MDRLDTVADLCLRHMLGTEQSVSLFFYAFNFHIRGALTDERANTEAALAAGSAPDHGGGAGAC